MSYAVCRLPRGSPRNAHFQGGGQDACMCPCAFGIVQGAVRACPPTAGRLRASVHRRGGLRWPELHRPRQPRSCGSVKPIAGGQSTRPVSVSDPSGSKVPDDLRSYSWILHWSFTTRMLPSAWFSLMFQTPPAASGIQPRPGTAGGRGLPAPSLTLKKVSENYSRAHKGRAVQGRPLG